jgi:hypothetical protein
VIKINTDIPEKVKVSWKGKTLLVPVALASALSFSNSGDVNPVLADEESSPYVHRLDRNSNRNHYVHTLHDGSYGVLHPIPNSRVSTEDEIPPQP